MTSTTFPLFDKEESNEILILVITLVNRSCLLTFFVITSVNRSCLTFSG